MDKIHEHLPMIEIDPYPTPISSPEPTPTIEATPTPTEEPTSNMPSQENNEESANTVDSNDNSAEQYRVTPPPSIYWNEQYDPTEEPN